jgi:hypothetical protein
MGPDAHTLPGGIVCTTSAKPVLSRRKNAAQRPSKKSKVAEMFPTIIALFGRQSTAISPLVSTHGACVSGETGIVFFDHALYRTPTKGGIEYDYSKKPNVSNN